MTNLMVSAASYPPLQKSQGRGTLSFETGRVKQIKKDGPPARYLLRHKEFEHACMERYASDVAQGNVVPHD